MRCRYLLAVGAVSPAIVERLRLRVGNLLPIQSVSRAAHLFASALAPVMPLPEIDGWLLGTLFSSDGRTHVTSLSSPSQLAVVSTGGRNLIEHYSGSYMAFWSPGQEDAALLRDPTATMPILTTIVEGVMLVASDLAILAAALNGPLTIDWSALAHRLRYPNLPSAQTCIESIVEILPGQLWSWQSGQIVKDQIWQPGTFGLPAKTSADVSVDPRELGAAIDAVVAGWSGRFSSILLELSGGLDSSILAASLASTLVSWTAVTLATRGADGDERAFARLVAGKFAAPLSELVIGDELIGILDPPTRLTVQPGGVGILRKVDRLLADHADRARSDVIFSGTGGDNVFCSVSSVAPVLDAWRAGGLPLARRAASDLATLTGTTQWDVGRHLMRRTWRQALGGSAWMIDDRFLSNDVRPRLDPHPWLDLPKGSPVGLRAHISSLLRIHGVLGAHDRIADHQMVFPLLSQPIMEWCLSKPTWAWIAGGRDRALARTAFAGRLPAEILGRTQKGRLESAFLPAYDRGRRHLADLLLDGVLAKARLIDRNAISAALERPAVARDTLYSRLLVLADAELWVRRINDHNAAFPSR